MNKILILIIILALYVNAKVIPFDNSAVEQIFQNKKAALFLFTTNDDQSRAAQ